MSKHTHQSYSKLFKQKAKTSLAESRKLAQQAEQERRRQDLWPLSGQRLTADGPPNAPKQRAQPRCEVPAGSDCHLFTLELTLRAPFLFKSDASLALGLDTATLADPQRRPLIPGTHIKGHLRQALAELGHCAASIDHWFGRESPKQSQDEPMPGLLLFDDRWIGRAPSLDPRDPLLIRPRIQLDPNTGTVLRGALQIIEQTHAAGSDVTFTGCIGVRLLDRHTAQQLLDALQTALNWIPALGALKGIGFGRVVSARVKVQPEPLDPVADPQSARMQLGFTLDRPYCFNARVLASNRFESSLHVPGAALRAGLFQIANRLCAMPSEQAGTERLAHAQVLLAHSQSLLMGHAWPGRAGCARQPQVVAQCVLADSTTGRLFDGSAAHWRQPTLMDGVCPAFPVDWKNGDAYCEAAGWPQLAKEIRVRTAIQPDTGAARDEALFSMDCPQPQLRAEQERAAEPALFRSWIDLSEVDPAERAALAAAIAALLPLALGRLGKTEARAQNIRLEAADPVNLPTLQAGQEVTVLLQSDALLGAPAGDGDDDDDDDEALRRHYHAHIHMHSGGALSLVDFWARQHWVGGSYLQQRFRQQGYRARLLTDAGSVFLLRAVDATAASAVLRRWLATGLPGAEPEDWQRNPWLRANGYGELHVWTGLPSAQPEDQR